MLFFSNGLNVKIITLMNGYIHNEVIRDGDLIVGKTMTWTITKNKHELI